MSDASAEPSDLFAVGRQEKLERQRRLAEALAGGPPEPEPVEVEVELDMLADAVAERLLGRLEQEPEREPGFFDGAITAKQERQAALVDALMGRTTTSAEAAPQRSGSFDGGARRGELRRPETHDETVAKLVLQSRLHRGQTFGVDL
jgi:hypothetical protein